MSLNFSCMGLIRSMLVNMIPNKNRKAARDGSAKPNALVKGRKNNLLNKNNGNNNQRVVAPIAMSRLVKVNNPKSVYMKNGNARIVHREYLQEVLSSDIFRVVGLGINPGLPGTFPWLCQIAARYESYRFKSLKFEFYTESSTTSSGTIALGIDYDASDPPPVSKSQLMAYQSTVRSPVWASCIHNSTKQNLSKRSDYFVRTGTILSNNDIKLYDVGNLFVVTQGQSGDEHSVGELWVEYDVELMTPQLNSTDIQSLILHGQTALTAAKLLGTDPTPHGQLQYTYDNATGTITFNQNFEGYVTFYAVGTNFVANIIYTGSLEHHAVIHDYWAATEAYRIDEIRALVGQTMKYHLTSATSVTSSRVVIAAGNA